MGSHGLRSIQRHLIPCLFKLLQYAFRPENCLISFQWNKNGLLSDLWFIPALEFTFYCDWVDRWITFSLNIVFDDLWCWYNWCAIHFGPCLSPSYSLLYSLITCHVSNWFLSELCLRHLMHLLLSYLEHGLRHKMVLALHDLLLVLFHYSLMTEAYTASYKRRLLW